MFFGQPELTGRPNSLDPRSRFPPQQTLPDVMAVDQGGGETWKKRRRDEWVNEPNGKKKKKKKKKEPVTEEVNAADAASDALQVSDWGTDSIVEKKQKKGKRENGDSPQVSDLGTDSVVESVMASVMESKPKKKTKKKKGRNSNDGLQVSDLGTDTVMESVMESEMESKSKKNNGKNGLQVLDLGMDSVMQSVMESVPDLDTDTIMESKPKKKKKKERKNGLQLPDFSTDSVMETKPKNMESDGLLGPDLRTDVVMESKPKKKKKKKERKNGLQLLDLSTDSVMETKPKTMESSGLLGPDLRTDVVMETKPKKKRKSDGLLGSELGTDSVLETNPNPKKKRKGRSLLETGTGFASPSNQGFAQEGKDWGSFSAMDPTTLPSPKRKGRMKDRRGGSMNSSQESPVPSQGDLKASPMEAREVAESPPTKGPKTKKKVRFQDPVVDVPDKSILHATAERHFENGGEVRSWKRDHERDDLVYGRFSKEEDAKITEAVADYIRSRGWDEKEGMKIVLRSSIHHARGCFLEIAKCLPYRPVKQINSRVMRLLGDYKRGRWSTEEVEMLKKLHADNGRNWKMIAGIIGRSPELCKDRFRRVKLEAIRKTGRWGQEEFDMLCKLVRRNLRVKASLPAKRSRRLLHDDISWEWISEEMRRDGVRCCEAWYKKLASPLVCDKKWAHIDDRILLERLFEMGASSEDAVDWDGVLDHRDGKSCMDRFKEMKRYLGQPMPEAFEDVLELLAKRYSPGLLGIEEEDPLELQTTTSLRRLTAEGNCLNLLRSS